VYDLVGTCALGDCEQGSQVLVICARVNQRCAQGSVVVLSGLAVISSCKKRQALLAPAACLLTAMLFRTLGQQCQSPALPYQ
jgi:hypothetical protein